MRRVAAVLFLAALLPARSASAPERGAPPLRPLLGLAIELPKSAGETVRARALEQGLIDASARLSESEIFSLILAPVLAVVGLAYYFLWRMRLRAAMRKWRNDSNVVEGEYRVVDPGEPKSLSSDDPRPRDS